MKANRRLWPEPAQCCWKSRPSDFQVEELWRPPGTGAGIASDGDHSLLKIRKVGQNTQWVARQIARHAGVRDMDVGFHGLKDRHAITTQWFSVYSGGRKVPEWGSLVIPEVDILQIGRTPRKLRRGEHLGNRFCIVLREVKGDQQAIFSKLEAIRQTGFPNYFGQQRFGRNGNNLRRADEWLRQGGKPAERSVKGLVLSAARSFLFNKILQERLLAGTWFQIILGDQAVSYAGPSGQEYSSPSGPLLGGVEFLDGLAGETEALALADFMPWMLGLHKAGTRTSRRAFVAHAENFAVDAEGENIIIRFDLAPGSYASVLLDQVFDLRAADTAEEI